MNRLDQLSKLTPLKAEILMEVEENQPTYASDVSNSINSSRQLVSKYLRVMEEHGWVQQDEKIANAQLYTLTITGEELLSAVTSFVEKSEGDNQSK